ncbi:MAG: DUF4385 domain-containing protein [Sphingobacteriaceae bacterium]|nr:DUF4385 domain-containing protein [Cytophagaceae bacterium]
MATSIRSSSRAFPYDLDFKTTDFRRHPDLYRVGVGEQGVLLVEPYKSEILPHWRFRTPEIARKSAAKIYDLFEAYLKAGDFVGADMARKFLQMGYTRSRRYANHHSGRKYAAGEIPQNEGKTYPYSSGSRNKGNAVLPVEKDAFTSEKAQSAAIFYEAWQRAKDHPEYGRQKEEFNRKLSSGVDL